MADDRAFVRRGYRGSKPSIADRIEVGDCWLWTGWHDSHGYGQIIDNGRRVRRFLYLVIAARAKPKSDTAANKGTVGNLRERWMYEELVGPVPPGLELDHLCKQPACCNPDHLEPVTRSTNIRRSRGSTGERCKRGHIGQMVSYGTKPDHYKRCKQCIWENNHNGR